MRSHWKEILFYIIRHFIGQDYELAYQSPAAKWFAFPYRPKYLPIFKKAATRATVLHIHTHKVLEFLRSFSCSSIWRLKNEFNLPIWKCEIQPRPHSKSALVIGWRTSRTVLWLVAFVLITRIHCCTEKGRIFGFWLLRFCEENAFITNSL